MKMTLSMHYLTQKNHDEHLVLILKNDITVNNDISISENKTITIISESKNVKCTITLSYNSYKIFANHFLDVSHRYKGYRIALSKNSILNLKSICLKYCNFVCNDGCSGFDLLSDGSTLNTINSDIILPIIVDNEYSNVNINSGRIDSIDNKNGGNINICSTSNIGFITNKSSSDIKIPANSKVESISNENGGNINVIGNASVTSIRSENSGCHFITIFIFTH